MKALEKPNTHFVIKISDHFRYLTGAERKIMYVLLAKISAGRQRDRKTANDYLVVNKDEPYANEILKMILEGEEAKEVTI